VVKRLKQHFPHLQIILNGGITTLEAIESHLQWADGCMIGREAYSNPWLLAGFDEVIGKPTTQKTRLDVIDELRAYAEQELSRGESIRSITKSWLGLFHGQPGGRLYRQVLSDSTRLKANNWQVVEDALAMMVKSTRQ
jgi:tRNA-dihydrouridine synthase A